jgi:hypothetical protein
VPGNSYNGMEVHYDNKIGFFLGTVTMFSTGFYNCRAELNHKEYIPTFHYQLFVMRKGILNVLNIFKNLLNCYGFKNALLQNCFIHFA